MTFHQPGVRLDTGMVFFQLFDLLPDLVKDISDRLGSIAAQTIHKRIAGFDIELYRCDPRPVLSTVMLFFHEEVQLIETPQHGTILLLVIREGFPQADECQSAFVFDWIAHGSRKGKRCFWFVVTGYWMLVAGSLNP